VLQLESPGSTTTRRASPRRRSTSIFIKMAFQNLLRRPARTLMLVLAVAISTGAVLASLIVARGIEASIAQSFARMGADLIVVPEEAMVNITSSLLTVQPTDATIDSQVLDQISHISGIAQVAPQTILHVPVMAGMPGHQVNLIAFDPARDFTVMPWLADHAQRPMQPGEIIAGGRRSESVGDEIQPGGLPANVYGKLGRSGVGPFDESLFATYDTVANLAHSQNDPHSSLGGFSPSRISAVLVRLSFGATPEQMRFAIARLPGVKVITGASIVTSTRQTTTALMAGMVAFMAAMVFGSMILVSLLFSAIIAERRREIGLLRAIGSRRGDIVSMLVSEAVFATIIGAVLGTLIGCGLLLVFQHSLVYYLETLQVRFVWPPLTQMGVTALACLIMAALVGLIGSIVPAWHSSRQEPSNLIAGNG
jgi:putative ABC transport system permease protein